MEFEEIISGVKNKLDLLHHACLGAKQLNLLDIDSHFNLTNSFSNSLKEITSVYLNKKTVTESESDLRNHFNISCNMLVQSIEQAISNLTSETGKPLEELLELYNKVADTEAKSEIINHLKKMSHQVTEHISAITAAENGLLKADINILEKSFLKLFGFKASYPSALENIKFALKSAIERQVNLQQTSYTSASDLSDDSIFILINEATKSLMFPKKYMKHFMCLVKFSIELEQRDNDGITAKFSPDLFKPLISIILDIRNGLLELKEKLDILANKNNIQNSVDTAITYLSSFTNEIERNIILSENNLSEIILLLKEAYRNHKAFKDLPLSKKEISNLADEIESLGSKARSLINKKIAFYENESSLDKRLQIKIEGFECRRIYTNCRNKATDINLLKKALLETHDSSINDKLKALKENYISEAKNEEGGIFELVMTMIDNELNILKGKVETDLFKHFCNDLIDGYYFYEVKRLSTEYIPETAYACLNIFNISDLTNFIMSNIDNLPKNNIESCLELSAEIAFVALENDPSQNMIEVFQNLLNSLLARRFHKYAYRIHTKLQEAQEVKIPIIEAENNFYENLNNNLKNISEEGVKSVNYKEFLTSLSEEINQTFCYYSRMLHPSDFKSTNWQIRDIKYDANNNSLAKIISFSENLGIFVAQTILMSEDSPRHSLNSVNNLYYFYIDLLEALINLKDLNGALSIYTALTSPAISNLAVYIKNPVAEKFKNIFNLAEDGLKNLENYEKQSTTPIQYLAYQRFNEIDFESRNLPKLFVNLGGFLRWYFKGINKNTKSIIKPNLDAILSNENRKIKWIHDNSLQSSLDVEEYFLSISHEINPPLKRLETIEALGSCLNQFLKRDKVLRFNNNESMDDIISYISLLIQNNPSTRLNAAIETILLASKFLGEDTLGTIITDALCIYRDRIQKELTKKELSEESKSIIIIFFKDLNENHVVLEQIKNLTRNHPLHAVVSELKALMNEFKFIDKGIKSLSHPKVILLEQIISKIGLTVINILPESIKFFITHFDPSEPLRSENEFNQFLIDSLKNELGQTIRNNDAIEFIPRIIQYIHMPIHHWSPDEAISITNEILNCNKDNIDFSAIEKYIVFLINLKEHFSHYQLIFSTFSQGYSAVVKLKKELNSLDNIELLFKALLDETQISAIEHIRSSLKQIELRMTTLSSRYTLDSFPLLIEEFNVLINDFDNTEDKIKSLQNDLDEEKHLSSESQLLSLSHLNESIYPEMHLFYMNHLQERLQNNPTNQDRIINQAIRTNITALTSVNYKEPPIKLYKNTLMISTEDSKTYNQFYNDYLSVKHKSDEVKLKLIFSFCSNYRSDTLMQITLAQIPLLTDIPFENAFYFLSAILTENIFEREAILKIINSLRVCIEKINTNQTDHLNAIMLRLDKILHSTPYSADITINSLNTIHVLDEFNAFVRNNVFNAEAITRDLDKLVISYFAQSSIVPSPDYRSTQWFNFLSELQFSLRNFYTAYFNPSIRSKLVLLFLTLAEQSAIQKNFLISDLFIELVDSDPIKNDLIAFKSISQEAVTRIERLRLLREETLNPEMISLIKFYRKIENIKHSNGAFEGKMSELGELSYRLYHFHLNAIKNSNGVEIETDILDFTKQFSEFLPIHEVTQSLNRLEYMDLAFQNISPVINDKSINLKSLSIFLKNTMSFSVRYSRKMSKPTCISGRKAKSKIFTAINNQYSKMYDSIESGNIDQIQTLVRDFLTISQLFEECLIRNKVNPSPQIEKLNTFILHPELIELNRWYHKHRRLKKASLFKVVGKDPELDALWRINTIIEKLSVIDKLSKKIGSKLSIEKILNLKSVQRKMMALSFEIKDIYEKSQAETNAGHLPAFDNLDVFQWTRKYHKFEDEINDILGIRTKDKADQKAERWSWRFALEKIGILPKSDPTSVPSLETASHVTNASESEEVPYLTTLSNESQRQDQLINSLQSLLEGSLDSRSLIKEQPKQKPTLPFSTQFLINSFMQSFDWASDDIRVSIPDLGQHRSGLNLLGSNQYIPQALQVEVISLVLVTMDMISKLAGADGEYAPLNSKKIDNLVSVITHANDAINKYFIDTKAPPTSEKINELISKFKAKKDKLILSNATLHNEASQGLSSSITLNPSANGFLRHNEHLMHQMLTENIFEIEYVSVLSPETESLDLHEAMENDPETEALLDLLLNQEPEDSSTSEDGQITH
ncbi:MAG: RasGEF domain-containing protein [Gammaproteobacteria bacterium]